jgi:hypothetical protein
MRCSSESTAIEISRSQQYRGYILRLRQGSIAARLNRAGDATISPNRNF